MAKKTALASQQQIEEAVIALRGEKVLLDSVLAELYGVTTKALNQAVKRNRSRFPADFMFRLTAKETAQWNRSQTVTGSQGIFVVTNCDHNRSHAGGADPHVWRCSPSEQVCNPNPSVA